MKWLATGVWRAITLVAGVVAGWPPQWLADKMDEEERRNRLV